jgi:uncharacterized membrane protein
MNLLFAFIGIIGGGTLFQVAGAVSGGIVGWLYGNVYYLKQRQEKQQQELSWLRKRLSEHLRDLPEEPAADQSTCVKETPVDERVCDASPGLQPPQWVEEPQLPQTPARPDRVPPSGKTAEPEFQFSGAEFTPREPSAFETAIRALFNGENLLVKLGVVILFIGVSFLVKYAVQQGLLPIQLRLSGAALGGIALLAVGWRLRHRRSEYSLALQGGGIGILYLTVYAAFRLFGLIPDLPAFGLLVAISVLCGALAVLQESRTLALFGVSGGFVAPLLASIGSGDPRPLFSYYLVLNAGIIGVAWFRSWRSLNLAGFLYTFLFSTIWGAQFYRPAHFTAVEPFLVIFFLMYVAVALLFAFRQPPDLKGVVDGTLVFGTPIVAFALQAGLVEQYRYGLAWSALATGLLYLALFGTLLRCDKALRPLAEAFLTFGIVFLTLSVPLACDGRWTSAAWALEGAALVWAGFRQERRLMRGFGIFLQFAAAAAFCTDMVRPAAGLSIVNHIYQGTVLLTLSALVSSRIIFNNSHRAHELEAVVGRILTAWGLLWWFGGGLNEIGEQLPRELVYNARLIFIALSCGVLHLIERRWTWQDLAWPSVLLIPAMGCYSLLGNHHHPFANYGWLSWPPAFGIAWVLLYDRDEELDETLRAWLHAGAVWLLAGLAAWELGWQTYFFLSDIGSWFIISRGIVPILLLAGITAFGSRIAWPLRRNLETYFGLAALPLAVWSLSWVIFACLTQCGDSWPFPWLPLLNPLDLTVSSGLAVTAWWLMRLRSVSALAPYVEDNRTLLQGGFTAMLFIWLNSILARVLHFWGGVPFSSDAMFSSNLVQTSYTLFWSLLALGIMVAAVRRSLRTVWMAGAGLLGLVVVKLFLVDLASHGTVERIVSFVAVGLLLLVIGWFAPVPPRKANSAAT